MRNSILYVDGFNFYYGVTDYWKKKTKEEAGLGWCDFRALVERHFMDEDEELVSVKYFTSVVKQNDEIPNHRLGESGRYGQWTRAVKTIDRLQVVTGYYQADYQDTRDARRKARTEKQNEVNMAVEMMLDALHPTNPKPDKVYVLSADSDLMPAVFAFEERLQPRIPVTVLLPSEEENNQRWIDGYRKTRERLRGCFLESEARSGLRPGRFPDARVLTKEILAKSLLPYTFRDKNGESECPRYWQLEEKFLKQFCAREDWRPVRTK